MRILIVEDEEKLAEGLREGLDKNGYAADVITNGQKAFDRISLNHMDYDLIVLDLMLPDMDGVEITKAVRERGITTPIIVLTARDEVEDKVDLLLSGADDYMIKPFSFKELVARIQAIFRRPSQSLPTSLEVRNIRLEPATRKVYIDDKEIPFTLKEFMILEYFMQHTDVVVNREELLTHLWDFNYNSFSNVVDVHVKNIRKKLDTNGAAGILETVRGVGYRLKR